MHHFETKVKIATVAILVIGILAIAAVTQGTQTVMAKNYHKHRNNSGGHASASVHSDITNIVNANAFATATNTNSITFNPTIIFTPTNINSYTNTNTLSQLLGPILVSDPYATVTFPRG